MYKLVVVDDEEGIRTGVSNYFPWASLGIEVAAVCQDGVEALMKMATSPEFDAITGAYYDQKVKSLANAQAYDPAVRAQLKRLSEELAGMN